MAELEFYQGLVEKFGEAMAHELVRNSFKGDWRAQELTYKHLSYEILYHAMKLDLAVLCADREAVAELCADVGNCALILADKMGVGLADLPATRIDGGYSEVDGGMRMSSAELETLAEGVQEKIKEGNRGCAGGSATEDQRRPAEGLRPAREESTDDSSLVVRLPTDKGNGAGRVQPDDFVEGGSRAQRYGV